MLKSNYLPELKTKQISDIAKGDIIANLGEVLEVTEHDEHFHFVINRLKQKQVLKFEKDKFLILL
ncbi:hypothetical protein [Pedobacter nyackensis]|uniref:Uncharacterized protein n=1 Tax=Pedobacter nyackensis TaxID=475255 RepID=A0A1W2EK18_9SPHI|nr:hypothetical protein [Pedobacter nyackensis]SMD10047.1 hypothetical protein SAMN04488101_11325 [Pedobacter nyackensis]